MYPYIYKQYIYIHDTYYAHLTSPPSFFPIRSASWKRSMPLPLFRLLSGCSVRTISRYLSAEAREVREGVRGGGAVVGVNTLW